jgi:hypothetical protein
MADQEAKGEEFEKKAEKKLKGWGIFGSKYEDAADLFEKAGNCYKLAKACKIPSVFLPVSRHGTISRVIRSAPHPWIRDIVVAI